jgi:hypothetical protein
MSPFRFLMHCALVEMGGILTYAELRQPCLPCFLLLGLGILIICILLALDERDIAAWTEVGAEKEKRSQP